MNYFDVVIIGASASGLMCAIEAGKRGRKVIIFDHANKAGKKIRISGGGRCNFSNYDVDADYYLSENPHFCKSALAQYQYYDFLSLLAEYKIPWHEREHGQLFCDRSANDIIQMLLSECKKQAIQIQLDTSIDHLTPIMSQGKNTQKGDNSRFTIMTHSLLCLKKQSLPEQSQSYQCQSLVIATGGLSVSKMGASDFGLSVAKRLGLNVIQTRAGLVPLIYSQKDRNKYQPLAGIALVAEVMYQGQSFKENLLFTHKGLSGPVILQISSYWQIEKSQMGECLQINLLPELDLHDWLLEQQKQHPKVLIKNILARKMPKRLVDCFCHIHQLDKIINYYHGAALESIIDVFQHWHFWPDGTEGYRVAEVTVGGVDTDELSSKTLQSKKIAGLFFVGEVVDVTGHLGGYNFQWAWSSGYAAGQSV
jgi:predicted Rossmann fold flavoprotein